MSTDTSPPTGGSSASRSPGPDTTDSNGGQAATRAGQHTREFEAGRDQVREARQFLAGLLNGCPGADDAILVLSEFATNCVIHSASRRCGGTFTITAEICRGHYVRIEARDDGGLWNQRQDGDDRPHGLDIVASLATACGVEGDPLTGWTSWAMIGWHGANGQTEDAADPESREHPQGRPG